MNRSRSIVLTALLAFPMTAFAQQRPQPASTPTVAVAAEAKQFDFLLGHWTIEVHPKVSSIIAMIHGAPRLLGTWQVTRSADGLGVDDEMRIVDGSGNPISLNRAHRTWIAAQKHWKVSGSDVLHKTSSEATGQWIGGEMHLSGQSADTDGTSIWTRTRYFAITSSSFRMQQDRSKDNGRTWDEAMVTIDARRVTATAAR